MALSSGLTKPSVSSATSPILDLRIQARSLPGSLAPTLTITLASDTGFGAYNGSLAARLSGYAVAGTGQNVTFNTYYDAGNGLGVLGHVADLVGNLNDPPGYDSSVLGTVNQNLFSLTEVITIGGGLTAGATYSLDGSLSSAAPGGVVPDGGTTAALLGGTLFVLAFFQRKFALTICRMQKCKSRAVLAAAALAGLTNRANAAATVTLYDGVNPLITVVDNGPGDLIGQRAPLLSSPTLVCGNWCLSRAQSNT